MSGLRSFRMIWVSTDASSGERWRKRVRRMVERGLLWCFGYLERTDLSEYPDFAANSSESSSIAAIEIVLSKPSSCWIGSRPFNDVSYAIGIAELTGHVRSKTIFNSCPRQPDASSRLHFSKTLTSTPKQSASICTILVSCMSYLRRMSSSGKSSRKHIAVVLGGRGEKRLRSSVTHLRKT